MLEADSNRSNWLGVLGVVTGALAVGLVLACVVLRPDSLSAGGRDVAATDVALMIGCLLPSAWAWKERRTALAGALRIGGTAGLALGAVLVARHALESFATLGGTAALALGIGSVFAMLLLFAAVGSIARSATGSVGLGVLAGVLASALALELLLGFAFLCILGFPDALVARLNEPFRASGMTDPHAHLVRNGLESAFEALTRMPVVALLASGGGALANVLMARAPRPLQRVLAWMEPCLLAGGSWALYHANGLERSARPPFVMTGVLLSAAALCAAHPVWSAVRRPPCRPAV